MPTITLATVPQTITGPAILNIFEHTPKIIPSFLYSSAGLAIELAKPVIGTKEPAPANFPILLNMLSPVKKALIKNDLHLLNKLINRNFDLRSSIYKISNRRLSCSR